MTLQAGTELMLGRIAAMIPVSDINRAFNAYSQIFGFEMTFSNGDPMQFAILKKDDAELHLTLQEPCKPAPFNVAHMMVSDAAESCDRCRKAGFRIVRPLEDKDYGLRAFVFADHDGNQIDVGQTLI